MLLTFRKTSKDQVLEIDDYQSLDGSGALLLTLEASDKLYFLTEHIDPVSVTGDDLVEERVDVDLYVLNNTSGLKPARDEVAHFDIAVPSEQ